jgi:hypothetical protein
LSEIEDESVIQSAQGQQRCQPIGIGLRPRPLSDLRLVGVTLAARTRCMVRADSLSSFGLHGRMSPAAGQIGPQLPLSGLDPVLGRIRRVDLEAFLGLLASFRPCFNLLVPDILPSQTLADPLLVRLVPLHVERQNGLDLVFFRVQAVHVDNGDLLEGELLGSQPTAVSRDYDPVWGREKGLSNAPGAANRIQQFRGRTTSINFNLFSCLGVAMGVFAFIVLLTSLSRYSSPRQASNSSSLWVANGERQVLSALDWPQVQFHWHRTPDKRSYPDDFVSIPSKRLGPSFTTM